MGVVIGIVFLIAIVAVSTMVSRARTNARKSANSSVRQSLNVSSSRAVDELRAAINQGLASAGVRQSGSFDNTQFYRVNTSIQLELKVWAEEGRTLAHLAVPSVRSTAGRPVKLAPVRPAVAAAERAVRSLDPQAIIT